MASVGSDSQDVEYDVGTLNALYDRQNLKQKVVPCWGLIALSLFFLTLFLVTDLPSLLDRSISMQRLTILVGVVVVMALILQAGISALLSSRGGVTRLRIGTGAIEIQLRNRRIVRRQ